MVKPLGLFNRPGNLPLAKKKSTQVKSGRTHVTSQPPRGVIHDDPQPQMQGLRLVTEKIGAQKSHLQSSYVPYFDGHTLTYIRNIMNWKFRCVGHTQRGFVAGPHYHLWQLGSGSTRRSRRKHLPPVESGCPCFNGDCWGEIYSSSWRTFNIQRFVLLMCKPARIYS